MIYSIYRHLSRRTAKGTLMTDEGQGSDESVMVIQGAGFSGGPQREPDDG